MKSKLKLIAFTAMGTTVFWLVVVVLVFLFAPKMNHIDAKFYADSGALGMFCGTNTKTQTVTLVVEELPAQPGATGAVELVRHELAPREFLRVGIRELASQSK
jgi:hypothetical protein